MGTFSRCTFFCCTGFSYQYVINTVSISTHISPSQKTSRDKRLVEHGAVVFNGIHPKPTSWHLDKTPGLLSGLHLLFIICWPWSKVFLNIFDVCLLRYFWPSIQSVQQVGFCGKTPKTNVPWPRVASMGGELSSQAVHLLSADLDLGLFQCDHRHWEWNCQAVLTRWRLGGWNKWCSLLFGFHFDLKVASPLGTQPTTNPCWLSIV